MSSSGRSKRSTLTPQVDTILSTNYIQTLYPERLGLQTKVNRKDFQCLTDQFHYVSEANLKFDACNTLKKGFWVVSGASGGFSNALSLVTNCLSISTIPDTVPQSGVTLFEFTPCLPACLGSVPASLALFPSVIMDLHSSLSSALVCLPVFASFCSFELWLFGLLYTTLTSLLNLPDGDSVYLITAPVIQVVGIRAEVPVTGGRGKLWIVEVTEAAFNTSDSTSSSFSVVAVLRECDTIHGCAERSNEFTDFTCYCTKYQQDYCNSK